MDVWVLKASSITRRKQMVLRSRLDALLKVALLGEIQTKVATSGRLEGTATKNGVTSVWQIKKKRVKAKERAA
ncbi:hypothetical protein STSP2_02722 [Anaerohalosphaera lusitana]|uniref:Uncharacterized protein n=1 Tax=Anaerohalosphaera lusitana TaxID=1936003 RepID=A0A1U9NNN4_9BACT|nr:hypothetical protein [Anaerohalosphaera lusitana]AQT69531.1 hypothetical protein STSP2_02722 [Anaerohalosphaera lusitana]